MMGGATLGGGAIAGAGATPGAPVVLGGVEDGATAGVSWRDRAVASAPLRRSNSSFIPSSWLSNQEVVWGFLSLIFQNL
jgi:hypothetical protein